MTAPTAELAHQIRNTEAFIAARYTDLVLTPRSQVRSGSGTSWQDGPPKPAQRVRIIDQSSARSPEPGLVRGADGVQRRVEYMLLGMPEADFALYDTWTDAAGVVWELAELFPFNGYERRAKVVRYGQR